MRRRHGSQPSASGGRRPTDRAAAPGAPGVPRYSRRSGVGPDAQLRRGLGVECTFCHVGREGAPLPQIDFASDQKRTKLVVRQMTRA